MKIALLGHSESGKTSFMAAMYVTLLESSPFPFRATGDGADAALRALGRAVRRGQYPLPTDRQSEYSMTLELGPKHPFEFVWRDYRGGALADSGTQSDVKLLVADLREADGLVMFVSAEELRDASRMANVIDDLTFFVGETVADAVHRIPVAIAVTKADLVEAVDDALLSPLDPLWRALCANRWVDAAIFAVACGRLPWRQRRLQKAIGDPVLFCLGVGSEVIIDAIVAEAEGLARDHEQNMAQASVWNDLGSLFRSSPSYRELGEQALKERKALLKELRRVRGLATRLHRHVRPLRVDAADGSGET